MAKRSSALLKALPPKDPVPAAHEEIVRTLARARAGLIVLSEKLEDARVGAELVRELEDVLLEIQRAEQALDEQVVLQRIEQQQLRVHLQSLDLLRFAAAVARAAAPRCRKERKPLCIEATGSVLVMADADLLQRAMQALLDCALAHGRPKKPVVLDVEEEEKRVRLSFIVEGCEGDKKACPCGKHLAGMEERLAFTRKLTAAQNAEVEITRAVAMGVRYTLVLPKGVPAPQGLPTLSSGELEVVEE